MVDGGCVYAKVCTVLWHESRCLNAKHFGGLKDYRASEGREMVKYNFRGDVANTVQTKDLGAEGKVVDICQSACRTIKQLGGSKCATFVRVNNSPNKTYEPYYNKRLSVKLTHPIKL